MHCFCSTPRISFLSGYPAVEGTLARPHYLVVPRRGAPVFFVHEGRIAEVLEAGMVITIEPGVARAFGIFHVEQDVVVTPESPEVVSLAPWPLRTIGP